MLNDIRFSLRLIRKHKWFSLAIIITLALGIGINTTIFTLVNAVLYKPVPIPNGDRLVTVSGQNLNETNSRKGVSYNDFQEFKANITSFEQLEAVHGDSAIISEQGNPAERFRMAHVTDGLLSMLQAKQIAGRIFSPDDFKIGASPVALIGHSIWQTRYGSADDTLGRVIVLNGNPTTIIGIMPDDFKFPQEEAVWIPLINNKYYDDRSHQSLSVFGILKENTNIEKANNEIALIAHSISEEFPDTNKDTGAVVMTFHDAFNGGDIKIVFLTLLGAVAFVLLIACANVANMMMTRAFARTREFSIRSATGAPRWLLIRLMLIESLILSSLGGLAGLALSQYGVHLFDNATKNVGKPYWIIFEMDYVAFGYFAVISISSGILFGLIPAIRASRVNLNSVIKDDSPGSGSNKSKRLSGALVIFQFSLTVVLLACAGMMLRSFFASQTLNSFIQTEKYFTSRIILPDNEGDAYHDEELKQQFIVKLITQLKALPGVTHAAITTTLPSDGGGPRKIEIEGQPADNYDLAPKAALTVLTSEYLPSIGLPILSGRGFNETDGETGKENVVVTQLFGSHFWPDQNAVGKRFRFITDNNEDEVVWMNIIGVSATLDTGRSSDDVVPQFFITYKQQAWSWVRLFVKTDGDASLLAKPVRSLVQDIDPNLPLFDVFTLKAVEENDRWFLVVFGSLFLSFAVIGLLISSVGIYALVAQSTAKRTREIGIRMALGATAGHTVKLILSTGLKQLAIALLIGLVGAMGATQILDKVGFLVKISPYDPLVFISISLTLIIIGLLACFLPARKAANLDPLKALHHE